MQLAENPFLVLGVTSRDGRQRIVEAAVEKSLDCDEDIVREASSLLTNPRRRLVAELAWLPGVGPTRIGSLLRTLGDEPENIKDQDGLPSLAKANLLADGLRRCVKQLSLEDVVGWIIALAEAYEESDAGQIARLLNEERKVAGFPEVQDEAEVKNGLVELRRYYCRAIKYALNRRSLPERVRAVTLVVEKTSDLGQKHSPVLVDDLVDLFEVTMQGFLERETNKVSELVESVQSAAATNGNEAEVSRLIGQLEKRVKNWDAAAQPMQVSARSRGLRHELSFEVAAELRDLGLELLNEHGMLEMSQRLTALQREVFAEVESLVEQSDEDASVLAGIASERARYLSAIRAEAESWRKEITFEADLGMLFSAPLRISPEGVQWKKNRLKLNEVTRVRWGGTKKYVNGFPQGVEYKIVVGNPSMLMDIHLSDQRIYGAFIERLWKAVGVRLLTELLEGVRSGRRISFGRARVFDHGVELERTRLFGANERIECRWNEIVIGNGAGTFYMAQAKDKRVNVELSYQDDDNVHVLEGALRLFWKTPSPRLSDLLEGE